MYLPWLFVINYFFNFSKLVSVWDQCSGEVGNITWVLLKI